MNITFLKVDKSLCQVKLKPITVLLYDFVLGFRVKVLLSGLGFYISIFGRPFKY